MTTSAFHFHMVYYTHCWVTPPCTTVARQCGVPTTKGATFIVILYVSPSIRRRPTCICTWSPRLSRSTEPKHIHFAPCPTEQGSSSRSKQDGRSPSVCSCCGLVTVHVRQPTRCSARLARFRPRRHCNVSILHHSLRNRASNQTSMIT